MINLLLETIYDIEKSGHTIGDIIFIGSEVSGHSCNWSEFVILANKVYDDSWGSSEVATDLVIVFKDGQKMWRWQYDGSEGWEYSKPFVKPPQPLPISRVISRDVGGCNLAEINRNIIKDAELCPERSMMIGTQVKNIGVQGQAIKTVDC